MLTHKRFLLLLVGFSLVLLSIPSVRLSAEPLKAQPEYLFEMSLEQLMEIPITDSGTLTETTRRKMPGAITTISKADIQASGARSLNELLDITVPNLQLLYHYWEPTHIGVRGLISSLEDKYLLLVNGRVMNERTHFGALSERDLPMLRDIHHIDVIRGPGSALYGPGALSMVVNIITDNALTFQGMEITTRLGSIEEFYSTELKFGKKFSEDSGLFLYASMADYLGASPDDSPVVFGIGRGWWGNGAVAGGKHYPAGHRCRDTLVRDRQSYRDRYKYKFHGQYTNGGLDIWARYTSGGETQLRHAMFENWMGSQPPADQGQGYQQATVYGSYERDLTDELSIKFALSYDTFNIAQNIFTDTFSYREDEYYARAIAKWNPTQNHSIAFGGEWSREEFGLSGHGYPDTGASNSISGDSMPRWGTDTRSLVGEWQWHFADQWSSFIGGRIDWHPFTPVMFSPRAAVVHTPNKKDTWKFMWSNSVRMHGAEVLKAKQDEGEGDQKPEKLGVFELRYERQHNENLWFGASAYYNDHDIIGWNQEGDAGTDRQLGNMRTVGAELEAIYKTDRAKFTVSHGWTKLINFRLDGLPYIVILNLL